MVTIKNVIIVLIAAAAILLTLFLVAWLIKRGDMTDSAHRALKNTVVDYREAELAFAARDYQRAISEYETALAQVSDVDQEVLIRSRMARSFAYEGKPLEAINIFKDIVSNPKYTEDSVQMRKVKADAVVAIAGIFYQTNDKAIAEQVFSAPPFSSIIENGSHDVDTNYRLLLEYAVSLAEPANLLAKSRIGMWYALRAYDLSLKKDLSAEQKTMMENDAKLAESHFEYVAQNFRNPGSYYEVSMANMQPVILRMRAISAGALAIAGAGSRTIGDPEDLFDEALTTEQPAWEKTQTKYAYAVYLAGAHGSARRQDIELLLADLYKKPSGSEFDWQAWLANASSTRTRSRDSFILLAKTSPAFKGLLTDLGWTF